MRQSTFIAFLIPLLMLAAAMIFRYNTYETTALPPQKIATGKVQIMVHEDIAKLKELGIDATAMEEDITQSLTAFPAEFMESMEHEQITGMILTHYAQTAYGSGTPQDASTPKMFFTFDVECMDIDNMYTNFLNSFSELAKDDLVITDIVEDTGRVDEKTGIGVQTISFRCNGKAYQYDATAYNDWFDVGMLTFMNDVISEQNTDKHLYVTSDGYQECIVFYQTQFWAARFKRTMGMALEQP